MRDDDGVCGKRDARITRKVRSSIIILKQIDEHPKQIGKRLKQIGKRKPVDIVARVYAFYQIDGIGAVLQ